MIKKNIQNPSNLNDFSERQLIGGCLDFLHTILKNILDEFVKNDHNTIP